MAWDSKLQLKASGADVIATASGTAVDLGNATPNKSQLMEFRLFWTKLDRTTGDETYDIAIEESADNLTFTEVVKFRQLGPAAADKVFTNLNVNGQQMSRFGLVRKRYLRYTSTLAGTTPILNYQIQARALDAVVPDADRLSY